MATRLDTPPPIDAPDDLRAALRRYGGAVLAVAAAVAVRQLIDSPGLTHAPFLLLVTAVTITSFFGGVGPGLLATGLAALSTVWFREFIPTARIEVVTLVSLFVAEGMLVSLLAGRLHRTIRRARQSEANAVQLERKILQISDDERRRVGHDLHDGLGQQLTGIALLAEALSHELGASPGRLQPERARAQARQIVELTSEAIGSTRSLARGLSPVTLETAGLHAAMAELAQTATRVLGADCTFHAPADLDVGSPELELHLYRIAQEAVNNSVRHGKATRVSVTIELGKPDRRGDRPLSLAIHDNGVGLSHKTITNPGLGLKIMQYRARMIGATLTAERSAAGGGTVVRCTIPLSPGDASRFTADADADATADRIPSAEPALSSKSA